MKNRKQALRTNLLKFRAARPDYHRLKMREYRSAKKIYNYMVRETVKEIESAMPVVSVGGVFVELLGVRVRADYLRVLRRKNCSIISS